MTGYPGRFGNRTTETAMADEPSDEPEDELEAARKLRLALQQVLGGTLEEDEAEPGEPPVPGR